MEPEILTSDSEHLFEKTAVALKESRLEKIVNKLMLLCFFQCISIISGLFASSGMPSALLFTEGTHLWSAEVHTCDQLS